MQRIRKEKKEENRKEKICSSVPENKNFNYGYPCGYIDQSFDLWNDNIELNNEIINYKIIKIKLYLSSKNYIIGINITYENLLNGEIKELEHKTNKNIYNVKKLDLKDNEYLKKIDINFNDDLNFISRINFCTNKNRQISVGENADKDILVQYNEEDKVIVGCFGYYLEKINALGCIYVNKKAYIEKFLFKFFVLRKMAKENEQFKEKWNNKYKELDIDFRYLWNTVNLPDAIFAKIIKYCFI